MKRVFPLAPHLTGAGLPPDQAVFLGPDRGAVEAMERLSTFLPGAAAVEALSGGAVGARLARQARDTLARLEATPSPLAEALKGLSEALAQIGPATPEV